MDRGPGTVSFSNLKLHIQAPWQAPPRSLWFLRLSSCMAEVPCFLWLPEGLHKVIWNLKDLYRATDDLPLFEGGFFSGSMTVWSRLTSEARSRAPGQKEAAAKPQGSVPLRRNFNPGCIAASSLLVRTNRRCGALLCSS